MIALDLYDIRVEHLFEKMHRLHLALTKAGIPYRIVGGMAIFIQVDKRDAEHAHARLTKDIDVAVDRPDLERIKIAAETQGFQYRHAAGVDMLVDAQQPERSRLHLIFVNEKVRPEEVAPVPGFSTPEITEQGVFMAPAADLVLMKLTSFRLKDKVHIQDMDAVGLITPEIEAGLPKMFRQRLAEVRATR